MTLLNSQFNYSRLVKKVIGWLSDFFMAQGSVKEILRQSNWNAKKKKYILEVGIHCQLKLTLLFKLKNDSIMT